MWWAVFIWKETAYAFYMKAKIELSKVVEIVRNQSTPAIRTNDISYDDGYATGYNNAIDDVVEELENRLASAEQRNAMTAFEHLKATMDAPIDLTLAVQN